MEEEPRCRLSAAALVILAKWKATDVSIDRTRVMMAGTMCRWSTVVEGADANSGARTQLKCIPAGKSQEVGGVQEQD